MKWTTAIRNTALAVSSTAFFASCNDITKVQEPFNEQAKQELAEIDGVAVDSIYSGSKILKSFEGFKDLGKDGIKVYHLETEYNGKAVYVFDSDFDSEERSPIKSDGLSKEESEGKISEVLDIFVERRNGIEESLDKREANSKSWRDEVRDSKDASQTR